MEAPDLAFRHSILIIPRAVRQAGPVGRPADLSDGKGAPNIKGLGKLRYMVEQTFALLHQFKRRAVRWERRLELHDTFLSLGPAASSAGGVSRRPDRDRATSSTEPRATKSW